MNSERMKIGDLVDRWGAEASIDPEILLFGLVEAATAGEFDALSEMHGLITIDPLTLRMTPVGRGVLIKNLENVAERSGQPKRKFILTWLRRLGWFHVHRDAALEFARRHEVPPPSWWVTHARQALRTASVPQLVEYLNSVADGTTPEEKLEEAARLHFSHKSVTVVRVRWRAALKAMDQTKKLPRARPRKIKSAD